MDLANNTVQVAEGEDVFYVSQTTHTEILPAA